MEPFVLYDKEVAPGSKATINIPLADTVLHDDVIMTAHVYHGKKPGPVLFVSAVIHGDEINGVEIIRRLLKLKSLNSLRGTLVAIPVVNIYGFMTHSRYAPDGRDLNRCFPGSSNGALASRMAHAFFEQVVKKCTHGIDLHTGARHRENLPQIRANLSDPETKKLASCFGVPVIIDSAIRDGSLRESAGNVGVPVLLYEAGESLRFDEVSIRAGVRGIQNVMRNLGMVATKITPSKQAAKQSEVCNRSAWVRAPHSGVLRSLAPMGAKADKGTLLGIVSSPTGGDEYKVLAPKDGIVIGRTNMPLVYEGDALYHLAYFSADTSDVLEKVEAFNEDLAPEESMLTARDVTDRPIT